MKYVVDASVLLMVGRGDRLKLQFVAEMPRVPWTKEVTEKMLAFEPSAGTTVGLDAITAAHALAHDATVLTLERKRYEWIAGLRVDEL